jgi:hypothetical protein
MGKMAQIHYILEKKKFTYCQSFLISFNRLPNYKCIKIPFKPTNGWLPFLHINNIIKIGKPCC